MPGLFRSIDNLRLHLLASALAVALPICAGCTFSIHSGACCDPCAEAPCDDVGNECSGECNCVEQHGGHAGLSTYYGHKCLHMFGWPCRVCQRAVNFCAHNEAVGPPDIQGPGRFHPVPTRPVFSPVAE